MTDWIGLTITVAVQLVVVGIFVGVVRTSINSLTSALEKLEDRMDKFDGTVGPAATALVRIETLEREAKEFRELRDIVVKRGERQDLHHEATERALRALEERMSGAVAMIGNMARRNGEVNP